MLYLEYVEGSASEKSAFKISLERENSAQERLHSVKA